ncbi:MAG: DUF1566 domain-containing protein [Gemmatimonadota bacterium]|nr:MAG: DUF1566 domain-containing protein [Gemmatimonadota bacterium]
MRRRYIVVSAVAFVLFFVWVLALSEYTGNTDPTNPPGATYSSTLEMIFLRLKYGTAVAQSTFTEPTTGPVTSTMHTLNDIWYAAPVRNNLYGAKTTEVLAGKKFWGLNVNAGEWGLQTGALSAGGSACNGTMYSDGVHFFGTRWCDQGDGTVLDMTTGLVWLKDANYLGGKMEWDLAIMRPLTEIRDDGTTLTDGSVWGDWRLPTVDELDGITNGNEYILSSRPGPFDNVQSGYWSSSTSFYTFPYYAYGVDTVSGDVVHGNKGYANYCVWPVRAGQ